jgi:hypothetical protein
VTGAAVFTACTIPRSGDSNIAVSFIK